MKKACLILALALSSELVLASAKEIAPKQAALDSLHSIRSYGIGKDCPRRRLCLSFHC